MHEISLLENMREILEAESIKQGFSQIKQITLEVGKLSCVEPDALRFGFDVVMKNSLAENAELLITELDGLGVCQKCGKQSVIETLYDPCPLCGSPVVKIVQGMEMKIRDLVVI